MSMQEGNNLLIDETYIEAVEQVLNELASYLFSSESPSLSISSISVDQLKLEALANSLMVFGLTDPIGEIKQWFYDRLKEISSFFSSVVEAITKPIKDVVDSVWNFIQGIPSTVISGIRGFIDTLSRSITSLADSVRSYFTQIISQISNVITSIANALRDAASSLLKSITDALTSVSVSLQSFVSLLVSRLMDGIKTVGTALSYAFEKLSSALSEAARGILEGVKSFFMTIGETLKNFWQNVIDNLSKVGSMITEGIQKGLSWLWESVQGIVGKVWEGIQSFGKMVSDVFGKIWEGIQIGFKLIWDQIQGFGKWLWDSIQGGLRWLWDALTSIGAKIWEGLQWFGKSVADFFGRVWEGIQSGLRWVWEQLQGFGRWLWDQIQGGLRWLWNVLTSIGSKIWEGLQWFGRSVAEFFGRVWEGILSGLRWVWEQLQGFGKWLWDQVYGGLKWLWDVLTGIGSRIWEGLQWFGRSVADFFTRVWEGIKGVGDWIWRGIQGLADMVQRTFADIGIRVMGALTTVGNTLANFGRMVVEGFTRIGTALSDFAKIFDKWATALMGGLSAVGNAFGQFLQYIANLPQTLQNIFKGIVEFFTKLGEGLAEFVRDPLGFLKKYVLEPLGKGLMWLGERIWEGLQKFIEIILKGLQWIWERIVDAIKWIWERIVDLGKGISIIIRTVVDSIVGWSKEFISPWFKKGSPFVYTDFADTAKDVEEAFVASLKRVIGVAENLWTLGGELIMPFWSATLRAMLLRAVPRTWGNIDFWIEPSFGGSKVLGFRYRITVGEYFEAMARGLEIFANAYAIGVSMAIANMFMANVGHLYVPRVVKYYDTKIKDIIGDIITDLDVREAEVNMFIRSVPEDDLIEYARRMFAAKGYENISKMAIGTVKLHLAMYGLPKWYYDYVAKKHDELFVEVADRWNKRRTIPLSPLWEVPTRSELVTMMIRDMFYTPEDFQKVMYAHGVYKDVSLFYYLLHFRYPTPEKLADFYWRGMAKVLWFDKTLEEESIKAFFGIGDIKASTPKELNKKPNILNDMIMMYMKWHDYAPFAWHPEFPTDKSIMVELMADLPDKVDFRWLCVPPGTIILGDNKPIEMYNPGDRVLYGGKVLETFVRPYKGDLIVIKGLGLLPIKVTPEHPILVAEGEIRWKYYRKNGKREVSTERVFSEPFFIEAEKVKLAPVRRTTKRYMLRKKGHYLVVPRLKGEYDIREIDLSKYYTDYSVVPERIKEKLGDPIPKLVLDEDTAWMLGFYVGDGSVFIGKHNDRVRFYPSREVHIAKLVKVIERYGGKPVVIKRGNYYEVNWYNTAVARFLAVNFGDFAHFKRIPDFILLHKDDRILKAFLQGYLDADGNKSIVGEHKYEVVTVSKILALQIQLLCFRLGYICSISTRKKSKARYREEVYRLVIEFRRNEKRAKIRITDDFVFIPVVEVYREPYEGYVYNLETERNVYLVSNAIVHNCRWAILEHMSALGVKMDTAIDEIVSRLQAARGTELLSKQVTPEIKLDVSLLARFLIARGIHPYFASIAAVAEAHTMLTDEMTLLRTGFLELYRWGIANVNQLEALMSGLFVIQFTTGYIDTNGSPVTYTYNKPVLWLPAERRLIQLRAAMDRYYNLFRDFVREVERGVRFLSLHTKKTIEEIKNYVSGLQLDKETSEEVSKALSILQKYKKADDLIKEYGNIVTTMLRNEVRTISGVDIAFTIDDMYIDTWIKMAELTRDIESRTWIRHYATRLVAWIIYRTSYGWTPVEKFKNLTAILLARGWLTIEEKEFLDTVAEWVYGIVRREMIPTPLQLATFSEYMKVPDDIIEKVLDEHRVPDEYRQLYKQYIAYRFVKSDYRTYMNRARRAYVMGIINDAEWSKIIADAVNKYGFRQEEVEIIKMLAELEELMESVRVWRPSLTTIATISEVVPIPKEAIDKILERFRVDPLIKPYVVEYVKRRPLLDELRILVNEYYRMKYYSAVYKQAIPQDIEQAVQKYMQLFGLTEEERAIRDLVAKIRETVEMWRESAREYIPTPSMLATIYEYVPSLTDDMIVKVLDARHVPAEWRKIWIDYIKNRVIADDVRALIISFYRMKRYAARYGQTVPEDIAKAVEGYMTKIGFTEEEKKIRDLASEIDVTIEMWRENAREYIPTPAMLATIYEYVPTLTDEDIIEVLKARHVPEKWINIWLSYIKSRAIADDVRSLVSAYFSLVRYAARYGQKVPDEIAKAVHSYMKLIGFSKEELEIRQLAATIYELIETWRENAREYIPTPSMLATISEYVPSLTDEMINKVLEARRVPQEWRAIWVQYIKARAIADEVRSLLSAFYRLKRYAIFYGYAVPKDVEDAVMKFASMIGVTDVERSIRDMTAYIEATIDMWRTGEVYPTLSTLVTMAEYINVPVDYVKKVIEVRRIEPTYASLWLQYLYARSISGEVNRVVSAFEAIYTRFSVPEEVVNRVTSLMAQGGWTDQELRIFSFELELRRAYRVLVMLVPSIRQFLTDAQYLPDYEKLFQDLLQVYAIDVEKYKKQVEYYKRLLKNRRLWRHFSWFRTQLTYAYMYGAMDENQVRQKLQQFVNIGLLDPDEVNIIVDGIKIRKVAYEAYRATRYG